MKILVCIKQVIDPDSPLELGKDRAWPEKTGRLSFRMNRYDDYALEEALLINEKVPGCEVHAVTVGPERASAVVRKAMEMGVREGFHIITGEGYLPAEYTASLISTYARYKDYDLILCGVISEDLSQGIVGPLVAVKLSLPCAVSALSLEIDTDNNRVMVESELESGLSENVRMFLPAVVTVQSGINRPRYPSLSNVMRAKKAEVHTIDGGSIPEPAVALSVPEVVRKGKVLQGTIGEKADLLYGVLHGHHLL